MFKEWKQYRGRYIAWSQGAMVDKLDESWTGSCEVLAREWLLKKLDADDIKKSPLYKSEHVINPFLPHPFVHGDNTQMEWEDEWFQSFCEEEVQRTSILCSDGIDEQKRLDKILAELFREEYSAGLISSATIGTDSNQYNHCCAYVKTKEGIAFFDSNHGEIIFTSFNDFRAWFKKEVNDGSLQFLKPDALSEKKLSDFFGYTDEEISAFIEEAKEKMGEALFNQLFPPRRIHNLLQKQAVKKELGVKTLNVTIYSVGAPEKLKITLPESIKETGCLEVAPGGVRRF